MKKPAILKTARKTIEKWMEAYVCMLGNTDTGMLYVGQPDQQKEKNWEVVVLSLVDENNKVIAEPEQLLFDIAKFNKILQLGGNCSVDWEENQCDGCKARIPLNEQNNHQKLNDPTDPLGIGCTAHLYDRPKLTNGKISLNL